MADNNNPIKYSDLIKSDDSIKTLISQLEQLNTTYSDTLKNISAEAIKVKASIDSVSGATEGGRKAIRAATSDTDKLTQLQERISRAYDDSQLELQKLNAELRRRQNLNKIQVRLNGSEIGSYDRLSAQYSFNKIQLNALSREEREATEYGRQLVAETREIYEEMKVLQAETGKTALNVGNYSDASKGLTTRIENQTKQLALMRLEGQQNTDTYRQLAAETATLRDAVKDATAEISNMASDTSTLDSVLGAASAASGGFSVFTGAMELFGAQSESVQEAQRKLQAAIAITTGLQAIQNAVQRQSALMLGVSKLQTYALAKAEAYRRLIQIKGTAATIDATIAQRAFNLIANANPYILIATALITVVGALALFSSGNDKAAKAQNRMNETQKVYIDYLELRGQRLQKLSDETIQGYTRELNVARARNASTAEIRKIEDNILKERRRSNDEQRKFYREEIANMEANQRKMEDYENSLVRLNQLKAQGSKKVTWDVNIDGNVQNYDIDEAINIAQAKVDNYGRQVNIAVRLNTENADINVEEAVTRARRQQEQRDAIRTELDLIRAAEDAKNALIRNSFERQRITTRAANERQIADLEFQLKTEVNLTARGRRAINDTITSLREQLTNDLVNIENAEAAEIRTLQRRNEDIRLALMDEGANKSRESLRIQYERQIQDINTRLQTEKDLTEDQANALIDEQLLLQQQYARELGLLNDQITIDQLQAQAERTQLQLDAVREDSQEAINLRIQLLQQQRGIELAQNRQLTEDVRQSEADINAKYDRQILQQTTDLNRERALMLFDNQQALEASEFELLRNSEERKTRFRLQQERERLQKILELNEQAGVKLSDVEVQTIKNTIAGIEQEISRSKSNERGNDIYGLFGLNLDNDQKEAINESVSFAVEQLNTFLQAKIASADAAVNASNREVDAAQKRLDAEIEARNNGYASNVSLAQKELDLARQSQDQALRDQERAQKAQEQIQTIQQVGNLVTATSKIWGQLGFPLAIPAIAVMWGSFAAAKIKAAQVTRSEASESYGEGTVELLQGGSHQSNNDIDLGTKPNGTRRRAEGGEFFAVFNKRNSRKYRHLIPDVVKSLNNGTFVNKYINAYNGANEINLNVKERNKDLIELSKDVKEIKNQNKKRMFVTGDGSTIVSYKNLTRKIKN